ncbi:ABC transporter substrate-binding protein [Sulfurimonas autotrophica]|uniref:Periplasmic binding protein n=1 Tax=Sulfurimonas autotrophica (strain ATCC BAA-671 / DSM 16294 / JCM 11897 / OK10) TaxID=563040 RepID=E0USW5_SULAO|nr:helical backbone metal receptor [Sulfurimonas autotrophica]ADN08142.1 periplasmic binding protein [Sulfurimonas autotrophica DSM 16294]
MSIKTLLLISLFILNLWANERVVSLSPSITEIIYGLHHGNALVATSSYSLYPKEAQKLPVIGGYQTPNIEKIIALCPTLVVGQTFNQNTLEQLKKFHIKTVMLTLKTLPDIQNSIKKLGEILHALKEAKKLNTNITNAITNTPKAKHPHSVMIVYGLKEDLRNGIYIAGHGIFFDDIIKVCGNTNAYTSHTTNQPVLNYENVIALNPQQIIILHSHATEPNVNIKQALQNWYALPTKAAKNKKISIIDEDYLHIPSQRVALTIKRLCGEMND